jgi:hypothetical protein
MDTITMFWFLVAATLVVFGVDIDQKRRKHIG